MLFARTIRNNKTYIDERIEEVLPLEAYISDGSEDNDALVDELIDIRNKLFDADREFDVITTHTCEISFLTGLRETYDKIEDLFERSLALISYASKLLKNVDKLVD
jgi:hypothetical protein